MQMALRISAASPSPFPILTNSSSPSSITKTGFVLPRNNMPRLLLLSSSKKCSPIRATPVSDDTSTTVDYTSGSSVFPAEACETVGGEACDVEMYPETKLQTPPKTTTSTAESVDREYFDYNGPKTVFVEEACDDLGGEFCEPK